MATVKLPCFKGATCEDETKEQKIMWEWKLLDNHVYGMAACSTQNAMSAVNKKQELAFCPSNEVAQLVYDNYIHAV